MDSSLGIAIDFLKKIFREFLRLGRADCSDTIQMGSYEREQNRTVTSDNCDTLRVKNKILAEIFKLLYSRESDASPCENLIVHRVDAKQAF